MTGVGLLIVACAVIVLFIAFSFWEWSVLDARRRADRLDDRLSWREIDGQDA